MKWIAAALALALLLPVTPADASACGSFSGQSRRCFFSFFKPCMAATKDEKLCHELADKCRACNDKLFKCWSGKKKRDECSACSPAHSRCMSPIIDRIDALDKGSKKS